jgi:hypothetical protein
MSIATWSAPGTESANLAGTALDALANNAKTTGIPYDNSSGRNLYARVTLELGAITPIAGATLTLTAYGSRGVNPEDFGGGATEDTYQKPLVVAAGTKRVCFNRVLLYPWAMQLVVTNAAGVALAGSGNALYVMPYGESIQ